MRFSSTDLANAGAFQSLVGAVTNQNSLDVPDNTDIHLCSRKAGSGTLATLNINFENAPCFSGHEAIQAASSVVITPETGTPGSIKAYHSMDSSDTLEDCLEGLNAGGPKGTTFVGANVPTTFRWAMGVLSLDRNFGNTKDFRFIKIDGVSPAAHNVVEGKYKFWSELVALTNATSTTGISVVPGRSTGSTALATDIMANLGSADQIKALNVANINFGLTGFLGTATNPSFLPTYDALGATGTLINAAFDSARPVNPWTHEIAAGGGLNHCRVPSIPNNTTGPKAMPSFY
jgi:hypothetical protein